MGRYGQSGVVYTAFSQVIGKVDEPGMRATDPEGNPLLSVSNDGETRDGTGKKIGVIFPFRPRFFKLVASYFFFLDPAIALPGFFSLIYNTKGHGFDLEGTTQYVPSVNPSDRLQEPFGLP